MRYLSLRAFAHTRRPPYVGAGAMRKTRAGRSDGRAACRPGAAASTKVFAVRDRMIDVCSGKKNARFAAVTKWQIGVETSARATWASANFGVGSLSLSFSLALKRRRQSLLYVYYTYA